MKKRLTKIYDMLFKRFGPRRWWPAENEFEVIIGAILTQNTAWKNVEKAISNLKAESLLTPGGLKKIKTSRLAVLIKPAGYYNIKAKRIKSFVNFLFKEFNGSLARMLRTDTKKLRAELLGVNGIGPETADSILLYAAGRPVFVVDNYTKRIFSRHSLLSPLASYEETQRLFTDNLPAQRKLFNEYHALIVELGKEFCRSKPRCSECPLKTIEAGPRYAKPAVARMVGC